MGSSNKKAHENESEHESWCCRGFGTTKGFSRSEIWLNGKNGVITLKKNILPKNQVVKIVDTSNETPCFKHVNGKNTAAFIVFFFPYMILLESINVFVFGAAFFLFQFVFLLLFFWKPCTIKCHNSNGKHWIWCNSKTETTSMACCIKSFRHTHTFFKLLKLHLLD